MKDLLGSFVQIDILDVFLKLRDLLLFHITWSPAAFFREDEFVQRYCKEVFVGCKKLYFPSWAEVGFIII